MDKEDGGPPLEVGGAKVVVFAERSQSRMARPGWPGALRHSQLSRPIWRREVPSKRGDLAK